MHFREHEKLQKLFGSALSHLINCRFLFGSGDCPGGPQDAKTLKWPSVHMCWRALGAAPRYPARRTGDQGDRTEFHVLKIYVPFKNWLLKHDFPRLLC